MSDFAIFILAVLMAYKIVNFFWKKMPQTKHEEVNIDHSQEYERRSGLFADDGVKIGYSCYDSQNGLVQQDKELFYNGDRHLITFGATGSGKTSNLISEILAYGKKDDLVNGKFGNILAIDPKGQLTATTAGYRSQELMQEIAVINPFDVLSIPTATYNPLHHLDINDLKFDADVRRIAESLIQITKGDHWELSALHVVSILIEWVVRFEEEKNLITVRQLLNLPDDLRIEFFKKISECDVSSLACDATRYTSDSKEVRDCIQTATIQLSFLRDAAIERVIKGGGNEVTFADLKRKPLTIYLIIPPELLNTHGRFLRLLIASALGELYRERTKPKMPVLMILDEFPALGRMDSLSDAFNVARDFNIKIHAILQSLPQLKSIYGQKWESFLSAAGVMQLLSVNDIETAEYFSRRAGKETNYKMSTSSSQSTNSFSSGKSYTPVEELIFKPEELFGMPNFLQLLICQGIGRGIRALRLPYYDDPLYNRLADKDPYHMTDKEIDNFVNHMKSGKTIFSFLLSKEPFVPPPPPPKIIYPQPHPQISPPLPPPNSKNKAIRATINALKKTATTTIQYINTKLPIIKDTAASFIKSTFLLKDKIYSVPQSEEPEKTAPLLSVVPQKKELPIINEAAASLAKNIILPNGKIHNVPQSEEQEETSPLLSVVPSPQPQSNLGFSPRKLRWGRIIFIISISIIVIYILHAFFSKP